MASPETTSQFYIQYSGHCQTASRQTATVFRADITAQFGSRSLPNYAGILENPFRKSENGFRSKFLTIIQSFRDNPVIDFWPTPFLSITHNILHRK